MDFSFSENQKLVQEMAKDFAAKYIAPHVMEWDESQIFPKELFKEMGRHGLMGVLVPEQYGGSGFGYFEYVAALVEISKVCGSIGLSMAAHNSLCTNHILQFGNEVQKNKWLPKLSTGEWVGAWGLTESGTGSDAGHMLTKAEKVGNEWVLNGTKCFITHGKSGDIAVMMARTGDPDDTHAMSAFVIEQGTPGYSAGKKENKLGMRASETTEVILNNCRIPAENLLGKEGDGFIQALKILDGGRISIAALSLGIAQGAFDHALAYSKERKQFGQAISSFQGISFKLADMATEIEAASLLIYRSADLKMRGLPVTRESAMAKLYASEVAVKVANDAVQIFGGYGYMKDFPVEKYYRDAKLCTIGEGTSEIQKIVIGRSILK
ncbi:MAG: acyl-CoA dehydrogenase family protein [Opitutaceae bacterium]|nr:acyl-CoA dehydrogenase family protein [Cytophagales bacterium]